MNIFLRFVLFGCLLAGIWYSDYVFRNVYIQPRETELNLKQVNGTDQDRQNFLTLEADRRGGDAAAVVAATLSTLLCFATIRPKAKIVYLNSPSSPPNP